MDGIVFETVVQHVNFMRPEDAATRPYLCIDLEGSDYTGDWFIGKEVKPVEHML